MGIGERIREFRERAQSINPGATLVAVTKGVALQDIETAYSAGQRDFGESRVQELLPKVAALPNDCRWHFIGALQSNKLRRAALALHVLHTLESESQLREIAKIAAPLDCLIEVNIASEPQKAGILPEALDRFLQSALQCRNVRVRGLMTIGPEQPNAELMRPYFRRLRQMAAQTGAGTWLSMGMSGDFEVALQEGATHIRIGSAIFGPRARA